MLEELKKLVKSLFVIYVIKNQFVKGVIYTIAAGLVFGGLYFIFGG